MLEDYMKASPSDTDAVKQLERLRSLESAGADGAPGRPDATSFSGMNAKALELPIRSNWLPSDVDDRVPAVEPEAVCSLDEILPRVADQLVTLIHNVDHFTATETVADEAINKWGVVSSSEKRKFDYLVSIEQIPSGSWIVDEYRSSGGKAAEFKDGFITNGLPALVMVFHPSYVGNYDMRCEGLARRSEGLAWQVYFRQRSDKAAAIRGFQVGMRGSSHPAALKGRAWIAAESYQVVRLETDLVRPMPEIRLRAEHAAIEYGSVNFSEGNVKLWLPLSAEVHFEWLGQRIHRRHSFDNYMLFSIEEKERIGSPKNVAPMNSPERNSKDSDREPGLIEDILNFLYSLDYKPSLLGKATASREESDTSVARLAPHQTLGPRSENARDPRIPCERPSVLERASSGQFLTQSQLAPPTPPRASHRPLTAASPQASVRQSSAESARRSRWRPKLQAVARPR